MIIVSRGFDSVNQGQLAAHYGEYSTSTKIQKYRTYKKLATQCLWHSTDTTMQKDKYKSSTNTNLEIVSRGGERVLDSVNQGQLN